jgi:hypothetical protein
MTLGFNRPDRLANCRGSAFLEIMLVCSVLAGIVMAVTMGVHTLSRVSVAGEAGIRSADVQMAALMTSLEKDFAYADYVATIKDAGMLDATGRPAIPPLPSRLPGGFVQQYTPDKTNEGYQTAWGGSIVATAPQHAHQELHFVRGGEVFSIFTVAWNNTTKTLTLTRYAGQAVDASGVAQPSRTHQLVITAQDLKVGNTTEPLTRNGWIYESSVTANSGVSTAFITVAFPNLPSFKSTWVDTNADKKIDPNEISGLIVDTQNPDPVNAALPAATHAPVQRWNLEARPGPSPALSKYTLLVRNKSKL